MIIKEPKKILIMKFRNIGDVLLITPLIKNLKLNYPNALIDVAINKGCEDMLTLNPLINEIIIYNRDKIKKQSPFKKVIEEIKFALAFRKNNYDLVINTTKGDRGALLSFFSGADYKIGYPSKNKILNKIFTKTLPLFRMNHMVDVNLDSLRLLNIEILEKKVELFTDKKDESKIKYLLEGLQLKEKKFIHVHPVSRWMFKCINDNLMAKIIDYCEFSLNKRVVLTASPDAKEIKKVKKIISLCSSNPIDLSAKLTLKEVSALNKKSAYFIGVDTAIMHMSAANDTPTISFFGPTAAFHWGPWDNLFMESNYLSKKGIQRMGKHIVLQESWDCIPCDKDGCNSSKVSDCLMIYDFNKIKLFIDEYNK